MATRGNFLDDNYQVNYPLILETLTEDISNKQRAEEIVRECKDKQPTNKDDIPIAVYKCLLAGRVN